MHRPLTILAPGAAGTDLNRLVQACKDAVRGLHATSPEGAAAPFAELDAALDRFAAKETVHG